MGDVLYRALVSSCFKHNHYCALHSTCMQVLVPWLCESSDPGIWDSCYGRDMLSNLFIGLLRFGY